jgi:TRAP-type C4-dicarboxylate transport system permease small subunit
MTKETNTTDRKGIGDYALLLSVPVIIIIIVLIMIDVIGRSTFGFSLQWSLSLEQLLLMVVGYCSIAATWKAGLFINIDFIVVRFSKRTQIIFRILAILVSIACAIILIWVNTKAAQRSFVGGAKVPSIDMGIGYWKALVPLGFFILITELVRSLISTVKSLTRKKDEK